MKLNREKLVREELGESEPNSTLNSCYLHDRQHSLTAEQLLPNGLATHNDVIRIPRIVLEIEDESAATCDVTEPCLGVAADVTTNGRPPVYKGPRSNSMSRRHEMQVRLLQKKLEQVQNDKGGARTLGSAPSLVVNGVNRQVSITGGGKPEEFHSDVWAIKKVASRNDSLKVAGHNKADYSRPMYRKDIFYRGSIYNVAEYHQSQQVIETYLKSMTSIPDDVKPEREAGVWRACSCLPKTFTDVLKQMFDLSILRDPVFLIACLANMLGFLGIFVPFVFVSNRAISLGVEPGKAALLLSVIGE